MHHFTGLPSAAILIGALFVLGATPATAKSEWTTKERKPCVYCHVGAWDSQKYTEAGQYYKDHEHSFKGYVPKSDPAKAPADSKKKSDGRH